MQEFKNSFKNKSVLTIDALTGCLQRQGLVNGQQAIRISSSAEEEAFLTTIEKSGNSNNTSAIDLATSPFPSSITTQPASKSSSFSRDALLVFSWPTANPPSNPGGTWQQKQPKDSLDLPLYLQISQVKSPSSGGAIPIDSSSNLTYSNYIAGAPGGYNLELVFLGSDWTQAFYNEVIAMANLVCKLITGDLSDVTLVTGSGIRRKTESIDDLKIEMTLKTIDGVGNTIGSAGPSYVRTSSTEYYLPIKAAITFDSADAGSMLNQSLFDDVTFHEMLHCVGFGSVWPNKGLINSTTNTYIGKEGKEAYALSGFAGSLLIEDGGGSGTARSHWEEGSNRQAMNPQNLQTGSEIMTGYINSQNWLSQVTVASLEDMGYQTPYDSTRTTPFSQPVLMTAITAPNANNFVYVA